MSLVEQSAASISGARLQPAPPLLPQIARERLRALPHPPESYDGIPYYDDEFDMAQSEAHSRMVRDLSQFLEPLAAASGLRVLSDNPIWYWLAEADQQRALYPDYALADATADPKRITALDLRLVIELVSIASVAKEQKDSVRMPALNAANGVPEFLLLYPEPEDTRALRWFGFDELGQGYREWPLPTDRRLRSQAVPGLEIEVLRPEFWKPGRKLRLWYQGERLPALDEAVWQAEQAGRQAKQAERQAKQAERQAKFAEQRAEREREAREAAERQSEQVLAENARLRALLREAGLKS